MPTDQQRRERIQRWIGAPQTGDLNDPETLEELERDIVGLADYIAAQATAEPLSPSPSPFLPADRDFPTTNHYTPNKSGAIRARGVVFHHSCGASLAGDISWIKQSRSRVSYHLIIDQDGSRHQFVPFNRRAWHAGKSAFKGRSGCNGFMLGVAFSGDTYDRALTDDEIASAVDLVAENRDIHGWTLDWMTDHRSVSPGRKNDLNPREWQRLRNALKAVF